MYPKCKLREEASCSLIEKRLLWLAFTLKFHGFLKTDEFTTPELSWSSIHLHTDKVTVFWATIKDKSIPTRSYHWNLCHRDKYCSVRAINQYPTTVTPQQVGPLFKGGRFFPLTHQQLKSALHHLLRHTDYNQKHYASHSFRIEAVTSTAVTVACQLGLLKFLCNGAAKITNCIYIYMPGCYSQYHHCQPELISLNNHHGTLTPQTLLSSQLTAHHYHKQHFTSHHGRIFVCSIIYLTHVCCISLTALMMCCSCSYVVHCSIYAVHVCYNVAHCSSRIARFLFHYNLAHWSLYYIAHIFYNLAYSSLDDAHASCNIA